MQKCRRGLREARTQGGKRKVVVEQVQDAFWFLGGVVGATDRCHALYDVAPPTLCVFHDPPSPPRRTSLPATTSDQSTSLMTIGYGDVVVSTEGADRFIDSLLILVGLAILAIGASCVSQPLYSMRPRKAVGQRRGCHCCWWPCIILAAGGRLSVAAVVVLSMICCWHFYRCHCCRCRCHCRSSCCFSCRCFCFLPLLFRYTPYVSRKQVASRPNACSDRRQVHPCSWPTLTNHGHPGLWAKKDALNQNSKRRSCCVFLRVRAVLRCSRNFDRRRPGCMREERPCAHKSCTNSAFLFCADCTETEDITKPGCTAGCLLVNRPYTYMKSVGLSVVHVSLKSSLPRPALCDSESHPNAHQLTLISSNSFSLHEHDVPYSVPQLRSTSMSRPRSDGVVGCWPTGSSSWRRFPY